jgi:hypothetical protein
MDRSRKSTVLIRPVKSAGSAPKRSLIVAVPLYVSVKFFSGLQLAAETACHTLVQAPVLCESPFRAPTTSLLHLNIASIHAYDYDVCATLIQLDTVIMSDQPQSLAELCSIWLVRSLHRFSLQILFCPFWKSDHVLHFSSFSCSTRSKRVYPLTCYSYTEKPKYRCPRCKTQTCSLSCYKRHQQRASCNGQRDPAAYLKRSEWATPSGIDRDYNYLKSVERHVDRTGQDVRERGITAGHSGRGGERGAAGNKKVSKAWVPGSALQNYLSSNDIRVEKAPTGMSRQKANLTRVTNKGNVMWTVEWTAGNGKKSVDNDSSEGRTIRELWGEMKAKYLNAEKGKKRKRENEKSLATQTQNHQEGEQQNHTDQPQSNPQPVVERPIIHDEPSRPQDIAADNAPVQQAEASKSTAPSDGQPKNTADANDKVPGLAEQDEESADAPTPEHFYLLRPFTASKSIVLTPLDASKSLTDCLKGRTVLEFPTIYVLSEESHSLPAGFQLSEQYEKAQKAEEVEVDALVQRTNQSMGGALTATREEEKPLDANSILDMLKRDVGV